MPIIKTNNLSDKAGRKIKYHFTNSLKSLIFNLN